MKKDKLKILLTYPPDYSLRGEINTEIPNSLSYISSFLGKEDNIKIFIPDLFRYKTSVWDKFKELLLEINPDILGISTTSVNYSAALKLALIAKEYNPKIICIFGGAHPTVMPLETIKEKNIDVVVISEGEITFKELVTKIKKGETFENVRGIFYKNSHCKVFLNPPRELIADLNKIPFPNKEEIIGINNISPAWLGQIIGSRGCPFTCIFCGAYLVCGKKHRLRSIKNVTDEMIYLNKKYGTSKFIFRDSTFTLNKIFVKELCDFMIQQKMAFEWSCNTRVDCVDEELLAKMKRAGCTSIAYGVESTNFESLKKIHKGITLERIKSSIALTKKYKIKTVIYIMVGFPWDTKETMRCNVEVALALGGDFVQLASVIPLPGTELSKLSKIKINWSDFDTTTYEQGSINLTSIEDYDYINLVKGLLGIVKRYNRRITIKNKIKKILNAIAHLRFKQVYREISPLINYYIRKKS